jgi:hypothetical protein
VVGDPDCEKLLIRNQSISVVWGQIVNKIIENAKHYTSFYLVANYAFSGGTEVLPTELFNGLENRKEYAYIAKAETNFLGEPVSQVFRTKIAGIWTVNNLANLAAALKELYGGENMFDVEFEVERVTQYLDELRTTGG